MPSFNDDEELKRQPLVEKLSASMSFEVPKDVGEEVDVTLIHHFVGIVVGIWDKGVRVPRSTDSASRCRDALPKSRNSRQEKRMIKLEIASIFWLCGSWRNLVGLPIN